MIQNEWFIKDQIWVGLLGEVQDFLGLEFPEDIEPLATKTA